MLYLFCAIIILIIPSLSLRLAHILWVFFLEEMMDKINPNHYKRGKIECIDAIESATINLDGVESYLVGNIIKYLWRYDEKNGIEDLRKAKWYLEFLIKKREGEK